MGLVDGVRGRPGAGLRWGFWIAGIALLMSTGRAEMLVGESCRLAHVPDAPLARDRHTTLLAHFDSKDSSDADYARVHRDEMGHGSDHAVRGKFGGGVAVKDANGFLVFAGLDNYDRFKGTAEFWVRARGEEPIWSDGVGRWLLVLYPERGEYESRYGMKPHFLSLHKAPDGRLVFKVYARAVARYNAGRRLGREDTGDFVAVPAADLDAGTWHHVLCSWDLRPPGRLWLLVNGEGTTARLNLGDEELQPNPGNLILLGGFSGQPGDGVRSSDASFDEFRIRGETVEARLAGAAPTTESRHEIDGERLLAMEDATRSMLDFLLELQFQGGLLPRYTWPALTPSGWGDIGRGVDMWFPGSARLGEALVRAWRIWGDDRYLDGAVEAAGMFYETQFPEGAWAHAYSYSRGTMQAKHRKAYIAQDMQSNQIRFLGLMWRLVGDPRYERALRRAGNWLVSVQLPSGAWAWEGHRLDGEGPRGHASLNDAVTPRAMRDLFVIWCATGDRKYLKPLLAAGQWLIDAQTGPPTHGWGDQYDEKGNLDWMRHFEPPAVSMQAIWAATRGLLLMYDLTGEDRYLKPLRKVLAWMESVPEEQRGWLWYAHREYGAAENEIVVRSPLRPGEERQGVPLGAGEPIVARDREMLPVTHDKALREVIPYLAPGYGTRHTWMEEHIRGALQDRRSGPAYPSRFGTLPQSRFQENAPKAGRFAVSFEANRHADLLAALKAFAGGEPGELVDHHRDYGRGFDPTRALRYCERLLDDIEAARVALGDRPPEWIPRYSSSVDGAWVYMDPPRNYLLTPVRGSRP